MERITEYGVRYPGSSRVNKAVAEEPVTALDVAQGWVDWAVSRGVAAELMEREVVVGDWARVEQEPTRGPWVPPRRGTDHWKPGADADPSAPETFLPWVR